MKTLSHHCVPAGMTTGYICRITITSSQLVLSSVLLGSVFLDKKKKRKI